MRRAIFISSGLGDALLSLPLAKRLRATSSTLVGIVTTSLLPRSVLQSTGYFDRLEIFPELTPPMWIDGNYYRCMLRNRWSFDELYLPTFGAQKRNMRLVKSLRGQLITLTSAVKDQYPHRTTYLEPITGVHDAIQNLRLANPHAPPETLSQNLVALPSHLVQESKLRKLPAFIKNLGPYLAIHVSGVQDLFPQKSWPIRHWQKWFHLMSARFPDLKWVFVGSHSQSAAAQKILDLGLRNVVSAVDSGPLESTMAILAQADMFVGLDGGLTHLAVGLGIPTFTIWGGSNPILYGYEQMDPKRHRDLSVKPSCGPCESWIGSNQSRVQVPRECPDFRCLSTLTPERVLDEFESFAHGLRCR